MNQNATKIVLYSFVGILILELVLMFYLHRQMLDNLVQSEFDSLMTSGAQHRDKLIENYNPIRIHQLIKKGEDQEVFITNRNGYILNSVENIKVLNNNLPLVKDLHPKSDQLVIENWRDSPYIASAHYFEVNEHISGYVVMFQKTSPLHQMMKWMNIFSIIAITTSFIFLAIVCLVISKTCALQKQAKPIIVQYTNA